MNTAASELHLIGNWKTNHYWCLLLKVRFWKFRKNPITPLFEKLYSHICTPIVTPLENWGIRGEKHFFPHWLRNKKIVTNCTKMNHWCHDSQIPIISPSIWKYDGTSENLWKKREMFSNPIYFSLWDKWGVRANSAKMFSGRLTLSFSG